MHLCIVVYVVIMNLAGAGLCIYDKRAAVKNRRRISEAALVAVALLGGCAGMYIAMLAVRHKTHHARFMLPMPLIIVLQAAAAAYCLV